MGMKRGDLQDTILSKVSLDAFEPKTGSIDDVVVVGFSLINDQPAQDLYEFLNNSSIVFRDVEVSPNPNPDNYFMVFVELDRDDQAADKISQMLGEINNIAGNLAWSGRAGHDSKYKKLSKEVIAELIEPREKDTPVHNEIQEFLANSDLTEAAIQTGVITLRAGRSEVKLDLVNFGKSHQLMHEHNLAESALSTDFDPSLMRTLNRMLGEMKAVAIDKKIVIYNPHDESNILITTAR